ncbi:hypothetical protein [Streptomyces toxytricini]|uniref:hypothetical protein n=1 Tax=Streptomyces toxytricini TaxID=67369 RepID=UPI003425CC9C
MAQAVLVEGVEDRRPTRLEDEADVDVSAGQVAARPLEQFDVPEGQAQLGPDAGEGLRLPPEVEAGPPDRGGGVDGVPGEREIVEPVMVDLQLLALEIEQDRAVAEPFVVPQVMDDPDPRQAPADQAAQAFSYEEAPDPRPEDFGLTPEDLQDPGGGRSPEALAAYTAAWRDWQAERPTGIPHYKIGEGNDGWLVTPAEIRAALAAFEAQPDAAKAGTMAEEPRWDEWIDYLRRAAEHGGFRVE